MLDKIAVLGVGLIGGSFALALKEAGAVRHVAGVGRSEASLDRALELGLIDIACPTIEEAVRDTQLVMIAAPVAQTSRLLAALRPHLGPDTVVTDAGSTKSDVVTAARAALGERIAQFVPGHPIAGRETNGPDAAVADLYQGRKAILTPLPENSPAHIERVAGAWRQCGAIVHTLTPQRHDEIFAAVSHLPHLLAFALVDEIANKPQASQLFDYAASGFRDFTRIAGSSPEMWRDIGLANRAALLVEMDAYIEQLQSLRASIDRSDGNALEVLFSSARRARESWLRSIEGSPSADSAEQPSMQLAPQGRS